MLEFIITNYLIFIIIAIVLLLGLFGYMMDRKKYNDYRREILESDKASEVLNSKAEINQVSPINVENINNNEEVKELKNFNYL